MARSISGRKLAEWRQRLQRFRNSRQSIAGFCREEGVSPPSFYLWRRRLAEASLRSQPPNRPRAFGRCDSCRRRASTCNCPAARNWSFPCRMPKGCGWR